MLKLSMKWSLVGAVVAGLSSCMMDAQRDERAPNPMVYEQQKPIAQNKVVKTAKAVSSSTEPAQKAVPGPKRAAAPQLPVIQ